MALRPALSSGLPFSSVQTLMMFLRPGISSHPILGVKTWGMSAAGGCKSKTRAAGLQLGGPLETYQNALDFSAGSEKMTWFFFRKCELNHTGLNVCRHRLKISNE
jgi:hypothetical protein